MGFKSTKKPKDDVPEIHPICAASSIKSVFFESAEDTLPYPSYIQRSLHLLLRDNRNYIHQQQQQKALL